MSARVLPLVWLDPPGWPLPSALPPVGDLAPAAAATPRLAVLDEPVERPDAEAVAASLAVLAGVAAAGWLEPGRAVMLRDGGPVTLATRSGGDWHDLAGVPVDLTVLSAGRVRLALRAVP